MAKKPRNHAAAGDGKQKGSPTGGQAERDPKLRKGQYTGAGDSAVTKK